MGNNQENGTLVQEIKCIRALDGIISGVSMVALLLFFSPEIIAFPIKLFRYLYIVPITFVFILVISIPRDLHPSEKWHNGLGRLRFFSFLALGLSPFWVWWHSDINNSYFLSNIAVFVMSLVLCLYNLISIASASAEENSRGLFFLFSRFSRMVLIYVLIAPVLAFFITVWLGQSGGRDIFIVLYQIRGWEIFIFGMPLCLSLYTIWHWRQILVAKTHST
ncbi:MAG: hypothetical protein JW808_04695 [Victivallales bacterium]|nr:hypothetical protein [Victivallales bacterium]